MTPLRAARQRPDDGAVTRRPTMKIAIYTAGLAGVGAACAAVGGAGFPAVVGIRWWAVPPFFFLLAASASMILRFQRRDEIMALDLFEAVLAGTLLAFPAPLAVALATASQAAAEARNRNRPIKAAFNVAQWTCAVGVGSLVLTALRSGTGGTGRDVGALIAAMAVVGVVNAMAFAFVIRLAEGQPAWRVLVSVAPSLSLAWAVNTTVGLLFAMAYQWNPAALGSFVVLLFVLHGAYRGYATALADRARLAGLHRATRALAEEADPRMAIPAFLEVVRECFQCEGVDLVLVEDGGARAIYRLPGPDDRPGLERRSAPDAATLAEALLARGLGARITASGPDVELADLLRGEGWRDCLAAPLLVDGRVGGILCTYNRRGLEGFEEGELAVLEALANGAAGAVRRAALIQAIDDERRKLSDIVNRTSDGILALSADGLILTWNPGLELISGYRTSEMEGTRFLAALRLQDENGREVVLDRWASRERRRPPDLRIETPDREVRWLSCSYTEVHGADGRPDMLIVVARDSTKARELDRLRDDFVATVSHELRTPLTPIKGWADSLLRIGDRLDEHERRNAILGIRRQAVRLERLIVNILEASRIETRGEERRADIVDVSAIAAGVAEEYRMGFPDRVIVMETPVLPCRVRGSELWLDQIISNLLANATKYSPAEEPIELRVKRLDDRVEIAVVDRGPGIPPQHAERIFERFQRLDNDVTRSQGGAGLGLYIVRQLARAMSGDVSVVSPPAGGSAFVVTLPAVTRLAAVG